jgi:hypothetical protein
MPGYRNELKRKLDEATALHKRTTDPEEKHLLGADVRELERLVEIASEEAPDLPRYRH